jgi:hypothetical protein
MKRLLAATAFSLIAVTCPVYAQSQIELTFEQYIAMANADAAGSITFSGKDSGADYVEYKDVKIAAPDGSFTLETAFLRATEVSGMTALTFAPAVNISFLAQGAAAPTNFVVSSQNLVVTTNTIVADPSTLTTYHVDLAADALKIGDLTGDTAVLKALNVEQTAPVISFDLDMASMKAKGGWTTKTMNLLYDFAVDGTAQKVSSTNTDMALTFDMDVPQSEMDMPAFMSGQKNMLIKMTSSGAEGSGSMTDPTMSIDYTAKGGPSAVELSMVGGNFLIDMIGSDVAYNLSSPAMGVPPVDLSMSQMAIRTAVPFGATTAPGEANIVFKMADLVIGETGWAMIDPGATLPRDPLNIDVDVSSNVQFPADIMSAAMMDPMSAAKFSDATINSFAISAAGADVTADGSLTFDPSIPAPLPTGVISVSLNGVVGLMNNLAAMGMLPADQVGMFSGLLGVYAVPAGDDSYTTDIEFKGMEPPTVNGQPLPM